MTTILNPKYQRYADRLRELIEEGQRVASLKKRTTGRGFETVIEDKKPLESWSVKVENIIQSVFGTESPHNSRLKSVGRRYSEQSDRIRAIVGILTGALDDLENGYLIGQEFLVAGEVLNSVLEQAKQLNSAGFKDAAAVLGRVAIEDALKRIAREENIDDSQKASSINDDLKKANRYAKPLWRQIQVWLDIGNSAAHGDFAKYTQDDVQNMIEGIEHFLAAELRL